MCACVYVYCPLKRNRKFALQFPNSSQPMSTLVFIYFIDTDSELEGLGIKSWGRRGRGNAKERKKGVMLAEDALLQVLSLSLSGRICVAI